LEPKLLFTQRKDELVINSMNSLIEIKCLLCGSNDNTQVKYEQNFNLEDLNSKIFSARRTTEHYHYRILECRACGMVFSSPILPFEIISKLYIDSKQNYDNETSYISESYIRYVKENNLLFNEKNAALEIGCGNGFFLSELKKFGYKKVYGVEPSREAVSKSGDMKQNIFNGFFENTIYEENSFDLITCFQTLDHFMNPLDTLERIFRLLKKGGIVYFIVHDEKGVQAKLFGEKSPIYDVEHIYLFNKETLETLVKKAGFNVLRVFDVKNTYPLSYWTRMTPLPFKKQLSAFLNLIGLSKKEVSIYAGNIGIFIQK